MTGTILIGLLLAITALALVIAGRAATPRPDNPPKSILLGVSSAYQPPDRCADAQAGIRYYRAAYTKARTAMGLNGAPKRGWYDCAATRRRAAEWRHKARAAAGALAAWRHHHWAWTQWLPRPWYRLGSCETGYGGPPNWRHRNSAYEGAFGFAVSTWDGYKREALARFGDGPYPASAADATPRQQWNVALVVYGHFGMSGWGCRGAFYG